MKLLRRYLLQGAAVAVALALSACANLGSQRADTPPIVFVHGNGDTAALWMTTLWRFESNGWPRDRLHAIEVPYPLARDDDSKPQPGRTSTAEHMAYLSSEVDKVLAATGAKQVVLVANSRGGNAVRNYIQNGNGAAKVSHAILGGTPNHGVWAIPGFREGNEFSGTGPFLKGLNAAKNAAGDEVTGPVKWMTIRSDNNDKFAQPDGLWIGMRGTRTFVTSAGPELKGATNIVIPKIDHRETSYGTGAFDATYRFITGKAPATTGFTPEQSITLNGRVTGLGLDSNNPASGGFVNNLPVNAATVEIFETTATGERAGQAVHRKTTSADGHWGPFAAKPGANYEFVISAPGYATLHMYRSAFPRSSSLLHLRAERIADADKDAGSIVNFTRPRGYFDADRDTVSFDGVSPPPGIAKGVGAGLAASKIKLPAGAQRSISAEFNGQKLVGRTWPAAQQRVSLLELHD
ncbi:twin-arginine translocation pathway signal [Variovorax sp. PCZ-1]|uniref:twin-arginine translocation pathway signal n=1 Tax=Variovorax sp. PCZ-1 TaxID=2835533 RepID=UPI001BCD218B|nr:twin-arginine translocation pathway signal [Variovorax sp. PCZ-1]MBS7806611.1 twin-arginine translocation pathway signal [Variovorax sp. PCZ-1]